MDTEFLGSGPSFRQENADKRRRLNKEFSQWPVLAALREALEAFGAEDLTNNSLNDLYPETDQLLPRRSSGLAVLAFGRLRRPRRGSGSVLRPAPRQLAAHGSVALGDIRMAIRPLGLCFAGCGARLGEIARPAIARPSSPCCRFIPLWCRHRRHGHPAIMRYRRHLTEPAEGRRFACLGIPQRR